jgi:hypothetical protein
VKSTNITKFLDKEKALKTILAFLFFMFSTFAASIFGGQAQASAAPIVNSTAPSSVVVTGGDSVTVVGEGFEASSRLEINGIPTTSSYVNAQTITFNSVATVAGAKRVTVVNEDGQRFTLNAGITYTDIAPVLTSISPSSGPAAGEQLITANGTNFSVGKRQASQIATGSNFTCGLYDESVYCWGANNVGQLGNGTNVNSLTPVLVDTGAVLGVKSIKQLTAGSSHACVLTTDGIVACWGSNNNGQLGINTTAGQANKPTLVYSAGVLSNTKLNFIPPAQLPTTEMSTAGEITHSLR